MTQSSDDIFGFGQQTATAIMQKLGRTGEDGRENYNQPKNQRRVTRFFKLLEDFTGNGPAKADWVTRTSDTSQGRFLVYSYDNLYDGVRAGFKGLCHYVDYEWVANANPCPVLCDTDGVLSVGTAPDGVVSTTYAGHDVTTTNVDSGSLQVTGLPPGLTLSGNSISGTPTQAGTFDATFTATADGCTLTKILAITINAS